MNQQIEMLEKAGKLLSVLNEHIVFTGGATISLYLDEISAADARPTKDVDCVVEITSNVEYYRLSDKLREIGLEEDIESRVICRWRYQDLIIDIMPADPSILGFSNIWYIPGITKSIQFELPSGQNISIFTVSYLLASKIEAFNNRGKHKPYMSTDLEDIVLLLDGCPFLEENLQQTDTEVITFVKKWFKSELDLLREIAPAQLSSVAKQSGREKLLLSLIEKLAQ
ncbi:MAG: nucleotidyl transferase AbiEii/AbiGii toxin family protein [Hassallia sp.]